MVKLAKTEFIPNIFNLYVKMYFIIEFLFIKIALFFTKLIKLT